MGFLWFKSKKEKEEEKRLEREALAQAIVASVKAAIVVPTEAQRETAKGEVFHDTFPSKPYKKLFMINNTITVVLHDGTTLSIADATREIYDNIRHAKDELEIRLIFVPEMQEDESRKEVEKYRKNIATIKNLTMLSTHPSFEMKGEFYYLKGVDMALPTIMVEAFGEVLYNPENLSALENFWCWLAQNPNPEAIRDTYRFIENNDVKVTPHGLLVLYRSIVKVDGGGDRERVKEISRLYAKVKMAKKGPANFDVILFDEEYQLVKAGTPTKNDEQRIGNLKKLYSKLPTEQGNLFTDNYTKKMVIKIGDVYRIDEDKVDRDNTVECSMGLHVGSRKFGISSFGDTKVMCLVNPSKIRAVPLYDSQKMRVSEMFVASVLDILPNGQYMDSEVDLVSFDEEYFNISVEELKKLAEECKHTDLTINPLQAPLISKESIKFIANRLEEGRKAISTRVKMLD